MSKLIPYFKTAVTVIIILAAYKAVQGFIPAGFKKYLPTV